MNFDAAFFISQGISIVTAITSVVSKQLKTMKLILITEIMINLLVALSYILLDGGKSGAIVSVVGMVQSTLMLIYDRKGKRPHIAMILGFVALYLFLSLYKNADALINYFPAIAAACFALAIMSKKPKTYRIFILFDALFWLVYDICILSGNLLVHSAVAISAIIGMIRLDGFFGLIKPKSTDN